MLVAVDHTLGNTGFGDGAPRRNRRGRQSQHGPKFQALVYSLCPQLQEEGFFHYPSFTGGEIMAQMGEEVGPRSYS